jgi:hypothetical protein
VKRKKRSISDKERLDFLQKHKAEVADVYWNNPAHRARISWPGFCPRETRCARTIRQAIDAALRAERASRKERK